MLKKFICLAAAAVMATVPVSAAPWVYMKITYNYNTYNYSAESVYVNVNGKTLADLSMQPIILDGTTLVPAREVCEAFGAIVEWKKPTEEIYIACGDSIVVLKINSKTAYVDGMVKELTVPARIINNKTMIPVRFVSEAFNKDVAWDTSTRTIFITDKASTAVPSPQQTAQVPAGNTFDQSFMYDSVNKTIVAKKTNAAFTSDGNKTVYEDGDKTLKITFASDLGGDIKTGEYKVGSNGVESIAYSKENGVSVITIKSDAKLTPTFKSDLSYVYIALK